MHNHKNSKSVNKRPKGLKNDQPCGEIFIRGDRYTIYLHAQKDLNKLVPDSMAFMNFEMKEIRFSQQNLELSTILHELVHCYIASTYIHELLDLSNDDFEEIVCEVVSRNYVKIYKSAKSVQSQLISEFKKRSKK